MIISVLFSGFCRFAVVVVAVSTFFYAKQNAEGDEFQIKEAEEEEDGVK